jgi:hypothetical protein
VRPQNLVPLLRQRRAKLRRHHLAPLAAAAAAADVLHVHVVLAPSLQRRVVVLAALVAGALFLLRVVRAALGRVIGHHARR